MPISWNEVRERAIRFSAEWKGETREEAEAKSFWDAFFNIFGVPRRAVASFEEPVRNIRGQYSFIDLFWPGVVLVEHKSAGKDLGKAETQAFQYIQDLARENRTDEIPRYVIVSDFARVVLHDLEPEDQRGLPLFDKWRVRTVEFPLAQLQRYVREFAFLKGEKSVRLDPEDPANEKAYRIMADLHDALEHGGFTGHELERFLVRVLFCLFAEDNGIFEPLAFQNFIEQRTAKDGSDLGAQLNRLFDVLNTPEDRRQKLLDEDLAQFPYVNGALFAERLGFADFNSDMRNALLACCRFQWSRISPAVFGSLFQGIMEPKERRQQGGHYTSERNILKVVRSLFLDDLRAEFDAIKADRSSRRRARLEEFHRKLRRLCFLDPACGCGNFLIITYRELRRLELEVLRELFGRQHEFTLAEINKLSQVDVDQFYGIEIGEWPVRIAEVALWLMDHQMNQELTEAFGQRYRRLPLRSTPHIVCGNALRLDWKKILSPDKCSYVLGNPPFVGKQFQTVEQKQEMEDICGKAKGGGVLDYVTAWYFKAGEYVQKTLIRVGFVSTNSISQGEQVGILWNEIFSRYHLKIQFAHRTFAWESEAHGKAHVHVVIIGFGAFDTPNKRIYDYDGEAVTVITAKNISPYLVEGSDFAITNRSNPICNVPEIVFGSMPNDGGYLLFTPFTRETFLKQQPDAAKFLRRFVGAEEFLNGIERWCLWLHGENPGEFRKMRAVMDCVEAVETHRKNSTRETTKKLASAAAYFAEIRQPDCSYLLIPSVSSERRPYIPIGFMRPDIIASNLVLLVPGAKLYHLGVLSSVMHMAWVRQVCGRLKSDYRYSNKLVYNNYPWPDEPKAELRERVEEAAQRILDLRVELGDGRAGFLPVRKTKAVSATLADLYDGQSMPLELRKAHAELDRAVDRCYRPQPFDNERQRVEFLFALHEKITAPLVAAAKPKRGRKLPPGKSTADSEAAAAHFHVLHEEPPPYRTK